MIGWRRPRKPSTKALLIGGALFLGWCVWAYWDVIGGGMG